jgi:ABC-type phosphate/phosphonate transport system substrate-binding protein
MPAGMFRDVKPAMFAALSKPFYSLVETQTGMKSDLVLVASPDEMRQQLNNGQLQFGVFHGFEFAWMKEKDPTLKPIMVAAPVHRPLKAYVVVSCNNNSANNMGDLRGKRLALANGTREHARIFVDRRCQNEGCMPSKFFDAITNPNNAETALHEVYDNKVQAAIVDGAALQCFAERYPARAKKLRAVAESQPFPLSVVAIRDGSMPPATLAKFQDGMVKANSTLTGRNLMGIMQMTGFEPVPADYNQQLAEVVRLYPPPGDAPK